jgi:hypothetical protein
MAIKLKVPKKIEVEFVAQGNLSAELKPGGIVETESREFADFLISVHGLTEAGATQAIAEIGGAE